MIREVKYNNPVLIDLINKLDKDLRDNFDDLQDTYDQFNSLKPLSYIIVLYSNDDPIGCGAFKIYNETTVEIKRMYVKQSWRGKGHSKEILKALEKEAKKQGFKYSRLETGDKLIAAISLYERSGYERIPNYDQYIDMKTSLCFEKEL